MGIRQLAWLCLKAYLMFSSRILSLFLGSGLMATSFSILLLRHTSCCSSTPLWSTLCRHLSLKSSLALWKSQGKHFKIMDTLPSPSKSRVDYGELHALHANAHRYNYASFLCTTLSIYIPCKNIRCSLKVSILITISIYSVMSFDTVLTSGGQASARFRVSHNCNNTCHNL